MRSKLLPSLKTFTSNLGISAFYNRLELTAMACEEESVHIQNSPFKGMYEIGSAL